MKYDRCKEPTLVQDGPPPAGYGLSQMYDWKNLSGTHTLAYLLVESATKIKGFMPLIPDIPTSSILRGGTRKNRNF
jgi:hypothetical protein